ncbi:hypothetical protein [Polyangium fumosum]|uniref:Uncharacterized protein n=1 Tax=Polyangium fumosum TaxID=889272 RepID=A0A4V6WQT2_9BACT|nr:hypothetical protein [Polyangium fumosum]TKD09933.1 hypothetical protein E8A74_09990 [Polyangium fumosum]
MNEPISSHAADHEPPPPEPIDELVEDRKKRSRRLLTFGALAVVLGGGGIFGLLRYQDAQNTKAIAEAWSAFATCTIGAELDEKEPASQRFRRVQLEAMTMTDAERMTPGVDKPWPAACAPLGHAVAEVWKSAGRTEAGGKDLGAAAEGLAKSLGEPTARMGDLSEAIDEAFTQAKKAGVQRVVVEKGPRAPEPVRPLDATRLDELSEPLSRTAFTFKAAYTDAHPAGVMRLLIEEKGVDKAPFLCTFAAKDAKATCKSLPGSMPKGHGLRLWGTADDDSAPLVFAGERGQAGIFRADSGDKIDAMYSYGGYAKKDGAAAALGFEEKTKDLLLTRRPAGGAPGRTKLEPDFRIGNYYYSTQILWDHLILRGVTKQNERRLFVSPYGLAGQAEPSFADVGELPEPGLVEGGADEPPHIGGCRSSQAMVVRVKGYDNDFMSFLVGGKWSPPMSPTVSDGVLSCHGTEAVVTRLYPGGPDKGWATKIAQSQCTTAGCRVHDITFDKILKGQYEFGPRERKVDAVDVDGKLLVVWAAGERGGVRMRYAKAEDIERADDAILYDDLYKDGQVQKLSTLFDLRLFSREGFAILLLSTVTGVYALRFDPAGAMTPVDVTWE